MNCDLFWLIHFWTLAFIVSKSDNNECEGANPCKNGGTCGNIEGGFSCECPPSWTGEICDIGTQMTLLYKHAFAYWDLYAWQIGTLKLLYIHN